MMMMKPFEQEESSSSSPSYGPLEVIYRQQGDDDEDSEAEFAVGQDDDDREQGNTAAAAAIDDSTSSSSSKTQPQKQQQQQQQKDNGRLFVLLSCLSACLMPLLLLYVAYRNGSLLSAPFGVLDRDDDDCDNNDAWVMALATATLPVQFSALSAAAVREGSLALSQTGRTLVVGLPESMMEKKKTDAREPGRVVVLQQQQQQAKEKVEGSDNDVRMTYQTSQTILAPATDAYSGFGTAVALSSSPSTTLVIGMPRNVELSRPRDGPHVQTYLNSHNDDENAWKLQSEFPQLAPQDASGSWVAVSNDASFILYAAPNYHRNNSSISSSNHEEEAVASPGAVRLLHHGQPQALWMGDCEYGSFGQTVALSSSSSSSGDGGNVSVAVVTSGGCPTTTTTATTNQLTVHVYDLIQAKWLRTLVVDEPPDGSCTLDGTGTAAVISQDGRRIVVLAACLDQATLKNRQVIYTFESAPNEQGYSLTWRQQHKSTLIVDCELLQYRMSTFAASHDAKTLVLTGCRSSGESDDEDAKNANSEQQRGGSSKSSSSIYLLQWDDDRAEWKKAGPPQRKSGGVRRQYHRRQHDIVGAQRVALSGDGRVLAVLLSNYDDESGKLVVYQLPPRLAL